MNIIKDIKGIGEVELSTRIEMEDHGCEPESPEWLAISEDEINYTDDDYAIDHKIIIEAYIEENDKALRQQFEEEFHNNQ